MSAAPDESACAHAIQSLWRGDFEAHTSWWHTHADTLLQHVTRAPDDSTHHSMLAATLFHLQTNDHALSEALLERVEALIARPCAQDLWGVLLRLGYARHLLLARGDTGRAQALLDEMPHLPVFATTSQTLCEMARVRMLMLRGELELGLATTARVRLQLTEQAPHYRGLLCEAWLLEGLLYQWQEREELAEERLRTALQLAMERGCWAKACASLAMIAQLEHLRGDLVLARETYAQADALGARSGLSLHKLWSIFPRIVRLFLHLELQEHELAREGARVIIEEERACDISRPRQLARVVMIIASSALGDEMSARVHDNLLGGELQSGDASFSRIFAILGPLRQQPRPLPHREGPRDIFLNITERVVSALLDQAPEDALVITYHVQGDWVETPLGRHDLRRRHALRRGLLALLTCPAQALSHDALIAAAWPGEHIEHEAAMLRLRVLVHQLRKLGLRELILTGEGTYRLARHARYVATS